MVKEYGMVMIPEDFIGKPENYPEELEPADGSIGWSGGSTQNYILTAVNEKVKAAVCFFSFATLRHQFYQYR